MGVQSNQNVICALLLELNSAVDDCLIYYNFLLKLD